MLEYALIMYLKALEIQGFKSFADRTRLTFEPGMIAIVGPNGCGKSNVSDAIRWVLGEQRPSALRCSKMQDLIFNGTDARKPLGMVEVSLHFADCEQALGTEYAEVSIARRAYRSGENAYFLNKTPCRLKDIQRLFMGTGVGTTSYSVMAQGQIDAILSSRPEDRRAVFEEAAGVTKFKADRKEALRKIAQTEENLTRVTDILRELKRQSTLLQRQAEKAERAKTLRSELRGLDLYLSKKRIAALEEAIAQAGFAVAEATNRIHAIQDEADAATRAITEVNARIQVGEDAIARLSEQSAASVARHKRAQEIIESNLARIAEYRNWAVGLEREVAEARERIEAAQHDPSAVPDISAFDDEQEILQTLLDEAQTLYDERKAEVDATRAELQEARNALTRCDRHQLQWQQVLSKHDGQREERLLKRERLAAETEEAARQRDAAASARQSAQHELEAHRLLAEETREALITLDEDRSFIADDVATAQKRQEDRRRQIAAIEAQRELLSQPIPGEVPDAGRRLFEPSNPLHVREGDIIGTLADLISIDKAHQHAVESALQPWSQAIIVRDEQVASRLVMRCTEVFPGETLHLLIADAPPSPSPIPTPFTPLTKFISADATTTALLNRILYGYFFAETLPDEIPEGVTAIVTNQGIVRFAAGDIAKLAITPNATSLARHQVCVELEERANTLYQEIDAEEQSIATLQARIDAITAKWRDAQRQLERAQRLADQAAALNTAATRDFTTAETRFNELQLRLTEMTASAEQDEAEHAQARDGLDALAEERERHTHITTIASERLTSLEGELDSVAARLSEARFRMAGFMQKREHALAQARNHIARLQELESTINSRNDSIKGCFNNIEKLEADNLKIIASLDDMQQETLTFQQQIEAARSERLELCAQRESLEHASASARKALLEAQEIKTKAEVTMAENRARHQALMERLQVDYGVTPESFSEEPCAIWETTETPSDEWIETRMADIRIELDRIGPVNLLAIEEFQALEERQTFYQAQANDLEQSHNELMTLIKTINETSGKRFRETFDRANQNFEKMFTRLFHGGEARLVLLENTEDPLECGIDIIARPPGKKPQTISLLSGGERTMTAVSLLFAIFLIKPAPFCLLDELDAALDDSNIGRFVDALKDFLVHSQFLIITHNQHTIAGSDIVYGVTMPEKGVSRTLSMRFSRSATN